ncbi:MAG: S1 RNA-binding domain-containing protein [Chloroflexi bacterium]|nr:S1 RNA-binding domain-containing protein [Chloroflexota bacterium]
MSTQVQRRDYVAPPPPLDEGYWVALLNEGEFAEPAPTDLFDEPTEADYGSGVDAVADNAAPIVQRSDWDDIAHIMESDTAIALTIIGYNRGGLLVEWRSLRGFVPASQLIDFPAVASTIHRRNHLANRVGQQLDLRVIELNEDQNRLIFSERAAQAEPGERADLLTRLRPSDVVSGQVTNICDFGAFVDLGGVEGLIHISELSWGRVGHPADILQRGEWVTVHVLDVNPLAGRIALSLKRMHPDPWETVGQRYQIGEMVEGMITNVVDFGAFARIEEGLEGLIHVSELAEGHFLHPRNVVCEGQHICARILSIDGHARRLGLSLRALT